MRPHHHIAPTLALVLALAVAAPAAATTTTTRPVIRPNPDQQVLTAAEPRPTPLPTVRPNPDEQTPTPYSTPQVIVRVAAPNHGFRWLDAGVGAAGALGLATLGLGAALATWQRRARRTNRTAITG